jgi:hypothetical protein
VRPLVTSGAAVKFDPVVEFDPVMFVGYDNVKGLKEGSCRASRMMRRGLYCGRLTYRAIQA